MKPILMALGLGAAIGGPAAGAEPTVEYYGAATQLPFSEAVRVDDILYLSGQIGARPGEMALVEGGMAAQARQTMDNIGAALARRGLGFDDVFKCTVMLADMSRWGEFNAVYVTFFKPERLPARSAFGAAGLALGAQVEVECLARFPR